MYVEEYRGFYLNKHNLIISTKTILTLITDSNKWNETFPL